MVPICMNLKVSCYSNHSFKLLEFKENCFACMYFVYMYYMYIQFLCVCDLMAAQELKVQYFTI